jgi:hypothetical protein
MMKLIERICEEGEQVFSRHWDSGAPGCGAGVDAIYKFKDEYWGYSDEGLSGPYETFAKAMEITGFRHQ